MPKRYTNQCSVVITEHDKIRLEELARAGRLAQAEIVRAAVRAYLPRLERQRSAAEARGGPWRPRLTTGDAVD